MIANITEYQRAHEELQSLEQRLAQLQQSYPVGAKGFTKAGIRTRFYGRDLPEAHPAAPAPIEAGTQPHLFAPEAEEAPPPVRSARKPA